VAKGFKAHFWASAFMIVITFMMIWYMLVKIMPFADSHNIFRSLNADSIKAILILTIIYFAALPSSIISINLVRTASYYPSKIWISFLLAVQLAIILLIILNYYDHKILFKNFVWGIIFTTAGLNVALLNDFVFNGSYVGNNKLTLFIQSTAWYFICCSFLFMLVRYV
jgi:glucan phosphoethanolaminetransferase (alkaline phosphatase superfamily)